MPRISKGVPFADGVVNACATSKAVAMREFEADASVTNTKRHKMHVRVFLIDTYYTKNRRIRNTPLAVGVVYLWFC